MTTEHPQDTRELPSLPEPVMMGVVQDSTMRCYETRCYTIEQMYAYAASAVEAAVLARRPVLDLSKLERVDGFDGEPMYLVSDVEAAIKAGEAQ